MCKPFYRIFTSCVWGVVLSAVLAASCQKNDTQMDEPAARLSPQMKQDIELIGSLGYDIRDIEKIDDGYLVEGDIWLTDEWLEDARQQPQTRLTQHNKGTLVGAQYQNNLYLDISNLTIVSALWSNPGTNAVNLWNAVPNCQISISITATGSAEIKIRFDGKSAFGNSTQKLMKVTPPTSNGKPGSVTLNRDCAYLPDISSFESKVQNNATYLIMHAIGHALGLGHTLSTNQANDDDDWGTGISGTSGYDDKSIMVRERNPIPWSGFSTWDKQSFQAAFPLQTLTPGSIEKSKTIDQVDGVFSIASVSDAAGSSGSITYGWERKSGSTWVAVEGKTGKNLTDAPVPAALTSEYRRKASNGISTAYSNTCTVTNNKYKPLTAGSIEEKKIIEIGDPSGQLTILSTEDGVCPRSAVTYIWEIMTEETWSEIPSASGATLSTAAPMTFEAKYRRKAVCAHESKYSGICTVYNRAFLTGGTVTELVELNKRRFENGFEILSLTPASYNGAYIWEIYGDEGWTKSSSIGASYISNFEQTIRRTTKFRRKVATPAGDAYSNECTVINYAIRENPHEGTGDLSVQLGPYDNDFSVTEIFDLRGEYFYDADRVTPYGNDAFMELEITRTIGVEFLTGAPMMAVVLAIWSYEDMKYLYFDISSTSYGDHNNEFPSFEQVDMYTRVQSFLLRPGKYRVQLQGAKETNGGPVNHLVGIAIRGFTEPRPDIE